MITRSGMFSVLVHMGRWNTQKIKIADNTTADLALHLPHIALYVTLSDHTGGTNRIKHIFSLNPPHHRRWSMGLKVTWHVQEKYPFHIRTGTSYNRLEVPMSIPRFQTEKYPLKITFSTFDSWRFAFIPTRMNNCWDTPLTEIANCGQR